MIGGVKPVFAGVLRYKTKQFLTPFRLQYLGLSGSGILFSDSVYSYECKVGKSYMKTFQTGIFKPMMVFTVIECSRVKGAPQEVMLSNIMVAPKENQPGFIIGNPKPYV